MEQIDKYTRTYDSVLNSRQVAVDSKYREPYMMYQETGIPSYGSNVIKSDFDKNTLNNLFFSNKNIEQIQNSVRYKVFTLSEGNYTIGKQSDTELVIVMRSVFLQNSKNNLDEFCITQQIRELNEIVVNEIAPKILSEIQQHYGYLRDSTKRMEILDNPKNTNLFSRKNNLPMTPF